MAMPREMRAAELLRLGRWMISLTGRASRLTKLADEFHIALEAHNLLAVEPRSAAEPRSSAEPQCGRLANSLALARRHLEHVTDCLKDKLKMQGKPATLKKVKKKAPDEPRKARAESTASTSESAALALSGATGKKRQTPGSSALPAAPPGTTGKKRRIRASSSSFAVPDVRLCLSAAPVAAAPAVLVAAAVPAVRVAAVPAAPVAAVAAVLAEAESTSRKYMSRRTPSGTWRIGTRSYQTYIRWWTPSRRGELHVVSVTNTMSEFHYDVGLELFEKLVSGDIDRTHAKMWRSRILAARLLAPGNLD